MKISTKNLSKEYLIEDGIVKAVTLNNTITGEKFVQDAPNEFRLTYVVKSFLNKEYITINMQDCEMVDASETAKGNCLKFQLANESGKWNIALSNVADGDVIKTYIDFDADNGDIFVDSVELLSYKTDAGKFRWSRPITNSTSTIPYYLTQLGQPVYFATFFSGIEFVAADNQIIEDWLSLKFYIGRSISELKTTGYVPHNAVIGAALGDGMTAHKTSFFNYVSTFARPKRFRIQFNSWYDNMLDITHQNIEEMFREAHDGFKSHGLRDIDCYVVDDGYVDYRTSELWAFNKKFKDGFEKERQLTEEFNSTFGIWFGPRGGYSEASPYASKLARVGYPKNVRAGEICCGAPNYIDALTDKMCEYMREYNATYFKIDGFAKKPCRNKRHGHPVGGFNDLYFYSFQWEEWSKAFDKLRAINPDVFLNITSHSNTSPWALKYADAVWINNASDMYYEGQGGNLDQCLNYRDGRYQDFSLVRELQFPNAYIYNHEPCYASRNYNPPLPSKSHKTVIYTDKEFEQYLYMCMMRGTGFIELYYSPSMFNDAKWDINTKVLKWAEENFDVLSESIYFGGVPKKGNVYGYIAYKDGNGFVAVRNPKSTADTYTLDIEKYTHNNKDFDYEMFYNNELGGSVSKSGSKLTFELKPFEMAIYKIKYTK